VILRKSSSDWQVCGAGADIKKIPEFVMSRDYCRSLEGDEPWKYPDKNLSN